MIAYGTALCVSVLIRGKASEISEIIASSVILGVVFDGFESVFLYLLVSNPHHFHSSVPVLIAICAILKFVMLGLGISFIIKPFLVSDERKDR